MNTKPLRIIFLLLLFVAACNKKQANAPNSAQAPPDSSSDQANAPTAQTAPAPEPTPAPALTPEPQPPPPLPPPPPVVIPAGTVLSVRLRQAVGSKTSTEGDRFRASLTDPILVDGKRVAAVGSSTSGTVTEAHAAGRFKGGASLGLVLKSISIAGHSYAISTEPAALDTKGKGKRSAGMVGGGAAGGALIGGVAGGGKGAGIGALVGVGAGVAGAAFTGNRDIALPVESALTFKMTKSLTLKSEAGNQAQPSQQ